MDRIIAAHCPGHTNKAQNLQTGQWAQCLCATQHECCHQLGWGWGRVHDEAQNRCRVSSQGTDLWHISPSVWGMQTCTKEAVPHLVTGIMSTTTQRCKKPVQPLTCQPPWTQEPPRVSPLQGALLEPWDNSHLRNIPSSARTHSPRHRLPPPTRKRHITHGYISCLSVCVALSLSPFPD